MSNYLIHIGNKNSGRYPRGSGENPNQHEKYGSVGKLNKQQIKKEAKTYLNNYNNLASQYANKYSQKKYGIPDKDLLNEGQWIDSMEVGEKKAEQELLKKYGSVNLSRINAKAMQAEFGKGAAALLIPAALAGVAGLVVTSGTIRKIAKK